jgi:DNA-binding response OmpR family regulator
MLKRETFDLCILEYPLPDMTGVQLCSLIRQMGNDVPVIFFTAMSRPIDMEKAIASGANDFLSKPDDLDRFVPVVKRILQREAPVYLHSIEYLDLPRAA